MALFKVTTKRLILSGGKRLEAGMTAEVPFNDFTLPPVQFIGKGNNTSSIRYKVCRRFPRFSD